MQENEEKLTKLQPRNTQIRTKLAKHDRKDFVIVLHTAQKKFTYRDKFSTIYREIENSGVEINADSAEKNGEPVCEEIADDSQLASEMWGPDENKIQEKGKSSIQPKGASGKVR